MKNKKILIPPIIITIVIGVFLLSKIISTKNSSSEKDKFTLIYSNSIEYFGESPENSIASKLVTISKSGEIVKNIDMKNFLISDVKYELDGKIYFSGYEVSNKKPKYIPTIIEIDKSSLKSKRYYLSKDKNSFYILSDIYVNKNNIFAVGNSPTLGNNTFFKIDKSSKKSTSINIENSSGNYNVKIREAENNLFLIDSLKTTKINSNSLKAEKYYDINMRSGSIQDIQDFRKIDDKWYIMGDSEDKIYNYDPNKDTFSLEKNISPDKAQEFKFKLLGSKYKNMYFLPILEGSPPISSTLKYMLDNKVYSPNPSIKTKNSSLSPIFDNNNIYIPNDYYLDVYSIEKILDSEKDNYIKSIKLPIGNKNTIPLVYFSNI